MNIIGLGHPGCQIAKNFENYQQYKVFYIDNENQGYENFYRLTAQASHADYESKFRKIKIPELEGPTTLIMNPAGKISGVSLRLLRQIKNDSPIELILVKPDESFMAADSLTRLKITMGVLQEYTRSGLISGLYLVSNPKIEKIVKDLSLKEYWPGINKVVSSTYHMLKVFQNTEPLLNSQTSPPPTAKIMTFGVVNYDTGKEELFYDLEYPRTRRYFYGVNDETLEADRSTLHKIRDYVKSKASERTKTGFSIYSTHYEYNYVYSIHNASYIQEQKIDF